MHTPFDAEIRHVYGEGHVFRRSATLLHLPIVGYIDMYNCTSLYFCRTYMAASWRNK